MSATIPQGLIPVNILTTPTAPTSEEVSVRWGRILKGQHKYFCPECKQGFTKPGDVKVHQRDSCLNKGKKLYSCDFEGSDKSYAKQQSLRDHVAKVHLKTTRYSCQFCGEKFATNNDVVTHRKMCKSRLFSNSLQALSKEMQPPPTEDPNNDDDPPFPLIQ